MSAPRPSRLFLGSVPNVEAWAALSSVGISLVLVTIKFIAYYLTGSAAIFSDALESVVNIFTAAFAVFALITAHRPADSDHPYGHGKIEFLAASFEGGMILLTAVVIVYKTVAALLAHSIDVEQLGLGLILMTAAMLVNGAFGLYLIQLGKRQDSAALEADGHHLMADAVTSLVALVALLVVQASHFTYADPIAALLIAVYLAVLGMSLLRRSFAGLMDEQSPEDHRMLTAILESHTGTKGKPPRICGYHKVRHRHSGRFHWVDFHITLPAQFNLEQGHNVASAIEYEMEQALGTGNATAHVEPCIAPQCNTCNLPTSDVPPPPPHLRTASG